MDDQIVNINLGIGMISSLDTSFYMDVIFIGFEFGKFIYNKRNDIEDKHLRNSVSNISNYYTGKGIALSVMGFMRNVT